MKKLDFDLYDVKGNCNAEWFLNKMREICQAVDKINEKLFGECDHVMRCSETTLISTSEHDIVCDKCGWKPNDCQPYAE